MDFPALVREHFLPYLADYGFDLREEDLTSVIAFSSRIALWLTSWRDDFGIYSITRGRDGVWYEYPLGLMLFHRLDRSRWPLPKECDNPDAGLIVTLETHASALTSKCADVLRGDPAWIHYHGYEPTRITSPSLIKILDGLNLEPFKKDGRKR